MCRSGTSFFSHVPSIQYVAYFLLVPYDILQVQSIQNRNSIGIYETLTCFGMKHDWTDESILYKECWNQL